MYSIAVDAREIVVGRRTGLSRILVSFLQSLAREKIDTLLVCSENTDELFIREIFSAHGAEEKTHFVRLKSKDAFSDQMYLPKFVVGKAERFFSTYPKFPVALPLLGVRTYILVADLINFTIPQLAFLRVFGRLPEEVITLSEFWRKKICSLTGRDVKKVYAYISYLRERKSERTKEKVKVRPEIKELLKDEKFILYVGNFNPHKNLRVLIQAFRAVSSKVDFELVLAGGGGRNQDKILGELWDEKVKIVPFPSDDEIKILYRKALFFVFPSYVEGQGIPPIEAGYFGKAVICSDIPVLRETMGNSALFFDPKSPKELADKILLLSRNPKLRKKIGERCRKTAEKFTQKHTGDELMKIIFHR